METGEIIIYQPDDTSKIDVMLENDTVWLTQGQMAELFLSTKQNISLHVNNIFKEAELEKGAVVKDFLTTASDGKRYNMKYYNLDVIISVGYRVKSIRGTRFRQWANNVLKEYMLKGYAVNKRIERLERTVAEHSDKIDFFVRTSLPPVEGIFYNGQIFDAYTFVSDLIRTANNSIVLIDNYIDETVLVQLAKRKASVSAKIYTSKITRTLELDIQRHNSQYRPIEVVRYNAAHDRFLIIDDKVYHIGASIKDLGKRLFAFSLMNDLTSAELLDKIK